MRRALPLGGEVGENYTFEEDTGEIQLGDLFAPSKDSLFLYSFMYAPPQGEACALSITRRRW